MLITGASSGIGAATARAVAARGARVALVARSRDKLEQLAAEIGPNACAIAADVTRAEDIERMRQVVMERFRTLDIVFANAGMFVRGEPLTGDPEQWARAIDVNVTGLLRTLRATLPLLVARKSGHVLITASVAGKRWIEGQTVYCATKRAVYGIAEGLRLEMLPHNVKVTVVSPGWVANEFWDGLMDSQGLADAVANGSAITSDAIVDGIVYVLTQPDTVSVSELVIRPLKQRH
jgi:NADP-dependent 3-hydroxy acid dehydrogenase YdfG